MRDAFQYQFRFCCDPGFNDEPEQKSLLRFVREARIDDVLVFANVQEINTGHMNAAEQEVYLELMARLQRELAPEGVTLSVNHWHTLMHADLGKKLRSHQHFRRMVDPLGNRAELCVCPLCGEWRDYLTGVFARYAELHPAFLWVEDDFRLHNHAPLVWGGCFCEEHMKLFSERAGKTLTREEFVRGVLKPGEAHPYRKIWLDAGREVMNETARLLGAAVRAVSPDTKVGLMSSLPKVHAAEGRDWFGILRGLAAGLPPVGRPHLPAYCEMAPGEYQMRFNAVSMQTRAFVPPETELYPELENYPYSRFVKSRKFTRFQMLSALPLNPRGMTIDLYDLNGNGIVWEDGFQNTLWETKDFLNRCMESGVFGQRPGGVEVLVSPDSAYTLHTTEGDRMEELYPRETFFASLLPAFGIPFAYRIDPAPVGKLVAVSGQYFRNLSVEQLRTLFEKNIVLLDGDAAETLFDLGWGELAGIGGVEWLMQDSGAFTYEEVCDGGHYTGRDRARASALLLGSDALAIDYQPGAEPITQLCDSFRSVRARGLTRWGNAVVFPFGRSPGGDGIHEVSRVFINTLRRELFQKIVRENAAEYDAPPLLLGEAHLNPYYYPMESGFALYIVNASLDDCDALRLLIGGRKATKVTAISSAGAAQEQSVSFTQSGDELELALPLAGLEAVLLRVEAQGGRNG